MKRINFPTPLFSLFRGSVNEVTVFGELILVDDKSTIFSTGELIGQYPARSLLKPFQFLTSSSDVSGWKGFEASRFIPAMGSISATTAQVESLRSWYDQRHIDEMGRHMAFEPTFPVDEPLRAKMKAAGEKASRVPHPCFSKHMLILEYCERHGHPLQGYHEKTHPFQKQLKVTLEGLLSRDLSGTEWVTDGCQLPSPVLSMEMLARLYQRLCSAKEGSAPRAAAEAMACFPAWIGGPDRIDTRLMELNPGKLVAKEGADGLLAIGLFPSARFPQGAALVVKIASGYQPDQAAVAIAPLLAALGYEPVRKEFKGQTVEHHFRPLEKSSAALRDISPLVSDRIAVWPGDEKFRRKVSLSTDAGSHLTLSSIETTVHVGAHADALNHFEKSSPGIDGAPLDRYQGPCQVISVKKSPGALIEPADIQHLEIRAGRVLFKTGSYPNAEIFNQDFVAFSAEVISYLAQKGVFLIGIDTPSIDPFSSKSLSAHHAIYASGVSNLEGLMLDGVSDGIYELTALPLRLENADASPVRAVLRDMK